ncbi:hypothetical protein [Zavarzinella formosa]|uniref:hypothetical protein n=1 Tax=Zavarzinella formosa TaxID=360055 RepID=UPI000303C02D|nr:hypothetical protein [Zavarzinella formosa]
MLIMSVYHHFMKRREDLRSTFTTKNQKLNEISTDACQAGRGAGTDRSGEVKKLSRISRPAHLTPTGYAENFRRLQVSPPKQWSFMK